MVGTVGHLPHVWDGCDGWGARFVREGFWDGRDGRDGVRGGFGTVGLVGMLACAVRMVGPAPIPACNPGPFCDLIRTVSGSDPAICCIRSGPSMRVRSGP